MGLVLQYLSNKRKDLLNDLITAELNPASFHKTQGLIEMIDDITGLPQLLEEFKLREDLK